jgi:ABC-type spermidine/putrescine transport system permease subunit II
MDNMSISASRMPPLQNAVTALFLNAPLSLLVAMPFNSQKLARSYPLPELRYAKTQSLLSIIAKETLKKTA